MAVDGTTICDIADFLCASITLSWRHQVLGTIQGSLLPSSGLILLFERRPWSHNLDIPSWQLLLPPLERLLKALIALDKDTSAYIVSI